MAAASAFTPEERAGLVLALAMYGLGALLLTMIPTRPTVPPSGRIEVTFSEQTGLVSTAPVPSQQGQSVDNVNDEVPVVRPDPPSQALASPPTPRDKPRKPEPVRTERAVRSVPEKPETRTDTRVGRDFLAGASGAGGGLPAQRAGPQVQSSLLGAMARQLRPYWQGKVPEGPDAEKLVTILRYSLNRDGTLAGVPEIVRQEGITEANRPQARRHAEQAIRAVQLAAPFDLPPEYHDIWKRVTIRFDKRLM